MNLSVIGLQWGDEGKGKIIDLLTNYCNINIRYNGGHNAGHVIYLKNIKKVVRILPSGVLKKKCLCLISNNVALLLNNLLYEISDVNKDKIIISKNIFIINKIDELIDYLIDKILKIGTTYSGISIFYIRKYSKCCFQIKNLYNIIYFIKNFNIIFFYNLYFFFFKIKLKINIFLFSKKTKSMLHFFKNNIVNNNKFINNSYKKIFESSQGALLDFDLGIYPFVTCSNIINKSIFISSNFFYNKIKYLGIMKSYSTRVGNGSFLSKLEINKNYLLSLLTNEFGTNSLKVRKIGWLDLVAIIEMIKINNISSLILTKMDSLIFLKFIKIVISYKINNKKYYNYKDNLFYNNQCIFFNSWNISNKLYFKNEKNFHIYIRFIEKILNTPISIISIGKHERDIIFL
ncbi:adenylosuccinate synthetase [Candidatus Carsonella ruddii]|uniref:Adenylosuccinate synthetase n=1 Tax=Candidatus Carsonella ruddii (Diaphorina cf. continua) TaxID=2661587 RepID=A0A7R6VYA2_CARRU|nr:adenylosuccinate synthetase [Candidatus Carsonella ruddii (Diaphorina cf. continua)]BCG49252.1 adenylosuccinate synthetase [Candidatus Carsonella ruddii (Diaphorina cf. continua)]